MNIFFFITGQNYSLCRAELYSIFTKRSLAVKPVKAFGNTNILEIGGTLDPNKLLNNLGGTIKIGRIIKKSHVSKLESELKDPFLLSRLINMNHQGRIVFGISVYAEKGSINNRKIDNWGLMIKNIIKRKNDSVRWVKSKTYPLSSVIVTKNKLLERGGEINIIIMKSGELFYGQTLAVQDYEDYSQRDYGRPARSMKQGMLPPKLAKIMINLSAADSNGLIVDPFCGSGTILQEAWLLGYPRLMGLDINPGAIIDTKNNLAWLKSTYRLKDAVIELKAEPISNISNIFKPQSIDAIITEPYLGPVILPKNKLKINRLMVELKALYDLALENFSRLIKKGGRVVIVKPIWDINYNKYSFNLISKARHHHLIPVRYPNWVGQRPLIYQRTGQSVIRELLVLNKNS